MLLVFSAALFVSATLLFLIQPMFAKMILPLLGGTPGVWNTCMVFFQAALLAGYAYAHLVPRWLGDRRQIILHISLLLLVLLTLPIGLPRSWTPPAAANPIPWLFSVLLVAVGLPFFLISTTAPLLQRWFAQTAHAAARDPYFLYGASNLGSMMALVGYPLVVEPFLHLPQQTWMWTGGYVLLAGFIGGCAALRWWAPATNSDSPPVKTPNPLTGTAVGEDGRPTPGQRLWWVLLAFAPSSLLLGVTTYMSTDVAAVPLLWVVPLAIYLLTFVLIFARRPLLSHGLMVLLEPYLIIILAFFFLLNLTGSWIIFPLHLLGFFLMAMVCHGELMKYRPGPAHLTEFYLWMSVGGVLGGLFNALVAPMTFTSVVEYPLVIMVASLLRPTLPGGKDRHNARVLDFLLPLLLLVLLGGNLYITHKYLKETRFFVPLMIGLCCLAGVAVYSFRFRPVRFGLGVGVLMFTATLLPLDPGRTLYAERNFFGVLRVKKEGSFHVLVHGHTIHGAQSLEPDRRREPLTYFSRVGPLGQVFTALSGSADGRRVGIIGLGTGSIACYGKAGQEFIFYEIDPAVEHLARDPRYFTFLQDCPARVEVVLGDARLTLGQSADHRFDLFILDAFSSDAIPIHLITREALALYRAKLRPGGLLVFHISNKYLDLNPVLANLAKNEGLIAFFQNDSSSDLQTKKTASHWAVMARQREDMGKLADDPRWQPLVPDPTKGLWTDEFSNILAVLRWDSLRLQLPKQESAKP